VNQPVDAAALVAEIEEEAARRRQSGELAEFERELDRTFARFAPVDALEADFDTILAKVEEASVIDTRPPTLSARPGVARMKQGVAKATGFYVRHVAAQVSGLVQALTRAVRLLDERVAALEQQVPVKRSELWRRLVQQGAVAAAPVGGWTGLAVQRLGGADGRVLHAYAGDGSLLGALVAAGIDAYGVEPLEDLADAASDRAADIRTDDLVAHLEVLAPGSLGGVVLSGCVERLGPRALVDLAELTTSRLAPRGVLVVISAHPGSWARSASPLAVDLAEGRPFHPETWAALLAALRCARIEVHEASGEPAAVTGDVGGREAAASGPGSYAVTAVRAG
jgi:hypothetical protein